MSPFARVAKDANRVDCLLDGGFLVGASNALEIMLASIVRLGPEGGAANFEHCCIEWLARVVRLAEAKEAARESGPEHWTEWFAEAIRRRTAREMALLKELNS